MKDMKCFNCALKHLAAALAWLKPRGAIAERLSSAISYAKEIRAGHGKGADLDHRIDFLGELVVAEHLMDESGLKTGDIATLRRKVQKQSTTPDVEDMRELRRIYQAVKSVPSTPSDLSGQFDAEGELINACDHLKLLHSGLFDSAFGLKQRLEFRAPLPDDLDQLRRLWLMTEKKSFTADSSPTSLTSPTRPTGGCGGCGKSPVTNHQSLVSNSVFVHQHQCPGDIVALTGAIRDLKASNPRLRINVSTTQQQLWDNNPNLERVITEANAEKVITAECPLVHQSNTIRWHLSESLRLDMESKLGVKSVPGKLCADIHLSPEELAAPSQIANITGQDLKYWIIVSGIKSDVTVKGWEFDRFQQVVDAMRGRITFVQVGEKGHGHYGLRNVIDLRGRTSPRQFVNLMHHASGVICGITYPMHLATMQGRADRILKNRPCIVIAGGREPVNWFGYENHHIIRRNGFLPCCDQGGCWKNQVSDGGDRTCLNPVTTASGQIIPRCMDTITVDEVVRAIELYIAGYQLFNLDFNNPEFDMQSFLAAHPEYDAACNGGNVPGKHILQKVFAEKTIN